MDLRLLIIGSFASYNILLAAAILSSWFPDIQEYGIVQGIKAVTEPYLRLFRQLVPPIAMIDFSPMIALFALQLLESLLLRLV